MNQNVTIEMISGSEGPCIAINDTRIAGPKPWAGGKITNTWTTTRDRIIASLPAALIKTDEQGNVPNPDGEAEAWDCKCGNRNSIHNSVCPKCRTLNLEQPNWQCGCGCWNHFVNGECVDCGKTKASA